jgi:hypothetical protein
MSDGREASGGIPDQCQLCHLLGHYDDAVNTPDGSVQITTPDGDLQFVYACQRCIDSREGWGPLDCLDAAKSD